MAKQQTLQISTDVISDGVVLSPSGEIDLARSPSMRARVAEVMKQNPKRVVVDLSGVPYMDSSGVATLVEALQGTRKSGGRLVLCGLTPRVRSILEISRLDTVFTIAADRASAMSA